MKRVVFLIFLVLGLAFCQFARARVWQDEGRALPDRNFYCLEESRDGRTVYIGMESGLYMRTASEKEWNRAFTCRGQYKGVNSIYTTGDDTVYIATKNGLYKSHNAGKTWKRVFKGIGAENNTIYVLGDKENLYLGTAKGLFWKESEEKTWRKASGILGDTKVRSIAAGKEIEDIFTICNNEVYRVSGDLKKHEKVFSADFVEAFEEDDPGSDITQSESEIFLLNDLTIEKGIIYLATNRGLFVSRDNGKNWKRFNSAGLSERWINQVLVRHEEPGDIFAATRKGVFRYLKEEDKWQKIYMGMESVYAERLMISESAGYIWALCKNRAYKISFADLNNFKETPVTPERILSNFKGEPAINQVHKMAIKYAEVNPDKIARWRKGAQFKALLPKINLGLDYSKSDTYEIYTSSTTSYWMNGPADATDGWDISFSWDLGDLVWNESQTSIDVRSKLMVQLRDDVIDEVTRIYFERRRLQIELLTDPPESMHAKLEKDLRLQELTAGIDGLTGGRFSQTLEERK